MKTVNIADECVCCASRKLATSSAILMPFVAKRTLGLDPIEITSEWGIRDLKSGTSYTPCHSMQCMDCGLLFLDIRFNDDQMTSLYHGYRDEAYTRQRDHYEPGYANTTARDYTHRHSYLAKVEAWLAPHLPALPAVLDWGGGDGTNALFLANGTIHIHDISGVETVNEVMTIHPEHARKHAYDLVACSQVLEHVPAPLDTLREILSTLSPSTLLYIEVPHEQLVREHPGQLTLASQKRHWHEHINFFTEASLRRLLERADLRVLEIQFIRHDNGTRSGEVIGVLARLP